MDSNSFSGLHYDYNPLDIAFNVGTLAPYFNTYDQRRDAPAIQLPLHAPVPLPSHAPLLYSGLHFPEASGPFEYDSPEPQSAELDDFDSCDAQSSIGIDSCALGSLSTFPTPSELLTELTAKDLPTDNDSLSPDSRPEPASKARRRAMAKSVGFVPTDPDTISSHEKKRLYLESLEQYILYLHQQFELLGATPARLEQVQVKSYRGLDSKSIRTLLVHMENTTRNLNLRTRAEEQKFIKLRDAVMLLDAGDNY